MSNHEDLVKLVSACGLSTGHADTPEMLMREVLTQVEEFRVEIARLKALDQWTQFAAAALPTLMASALASGIEQEVQAVPEAVCATADAMMAAIAEREQGGRDG